MHADKPPTLHTRCFETHFTGASSSARIGIHVGVIPNAQMNLPFACRKPCPRFWIKLVISDYSG